MRQLQFLRRLSSSYSTLQQATGASPGAQLEIFDGYAVKQTKFIFKHFPLTTIFHYTTPCRILKASQRDRAAHYPAEPDPLTDEVAARLVDRLEDCTKSFPRALVLGGAGLQVLRALRGGRGGVESAALVDTSQGMLDRAAQEFNDSRSSRGSSGGENKNNFHVDFILADPEKELLPVEPAEFDVVISCLGLHWVNDVPVRYREKYNILSRKKKSLFNEKERKFSFFSVIDLLVRSERWLRCAALTKRWKNSNS